MSYILEALRKSDQQRHRGTAPTLASAQLMAAPAKPRARWPYAALAVVLAGTAFAIGWARPWQTQAPAPGVGAVAWQPVDTAKREATQSPAPEVASPRRSSVKHPQSSRAPSRASASTQPDVALVKSLPPPAPAAAAPAQPSKPAPEKPAGASTPITEGKVVSLAELPVSVRQQMPQMTISVHAYTRVPKDRLVGVNDKLLHEGDALAPGLVLERITPDGMIFNYNGTRFHRGVQ